VAKETGGNEIAEESELICTACEKLTALQKKNGIKLFQNSLGRELLVCHKRNKEI
jgi:hypothetical protein